MILLPRMHWRTTAAAAACAVLVLVGSAPAQDEASEEGELVDVQPAEEEVEAEILDESAGVRRRANREGIASQERINALSDETETLFTKYSNTLRHIDSIRAYNRQMLELISSQEAELASLEDQLERVDMVGRSVTPLMLRMIDAIEAFVELDVPFLIDDRTERIVELRNLMRRADVTNAEKYRAIMEAYQIENEFGRTIEAYRGTIKRGDREITVDFLRFGRIALVYQTLDESEAGVWNNETRQWEQLDSSYRSAIRQGLRIARKQAAPDLVRLPLPAATTAEGAI